MFINNDNDYARYREDCMIEEKPKNFVEGFGYGCNSLVESVKSGLVGVVARPYVETYRNGGWGMIRGLWQGVSGLLLKPASGSLDLFAKSFEGFKNTVRHTDTIT